MKKNSLINDLNAIKKNPKVFIQEVIKEDTDGLVTESIDYEIDFISVDMFGIHLAFSDKEPTKETIIKDKSDADLLSDCILLKLKEMGETEQKHYSHLKDSFFESKKRLLALHSRVCSLLDE